MPRILKAKYAISTFRNSLSLPGWKSEFPASGIRLWRLRSFAAHIDGGIDAGPFKGIITITLNQ